MGMGKEDEGQWNRNSTPQEEWVNYRKNTVGGKQDDTEIKGHESG